MNDKIEQAEVVVIGAGAAGSVAAAILAEHGKQVVVLESGTDWQTRDLHNSLVWGRRLRWGSGAPAAAGADPFQHQFNMGRGTGGSALHHYACWPRMASDDFRRWPLSYADLRPYYDRIQAEVGISGDASKESWRPPGDPYPMPALATFRHGELLAAGFERLGLKVAPQPMAINSVPYKGRPACRYDGWCDSGCAILALANPLAVYLPRAMRAGAQLRSSTRVTKLTAQSRGGFDRIQTVHWQSSRGERGTIHTQYVVLAANAIQNARLLLSSAAAHGGHALANSSGLLGRYFTYHTNVSVVGEFAEPTHNTLGPVAGTLYTREFDAARGQSMWHIGASIKPTDLTGMGNWRPDLMGPELTDFLERRAPKMANCIGLAEVGSRPENRIELSTQSDSMGRPNVKVTMSLSETDKALLQHVAQTGLAACKAGGASDTWVVGYGNSHAMGGTIMGSSPTASVTDAYGIAHDVPNLAIVGSGVYPTSGSVNPTFTIHALTLRTVERALSNWHS